MAGPRGRGDGEASCTAPCNQMETNMDREHSRLELLSVQLAQCGALAIALLALSGAGNAAQTASLSVTQPSLAAAMPAAAPDAAPASLDRLEALGMGDMVRVT